MQIDTCMMENKNTLLLITRCTRPENLPLIFESIIKTKARIYASNIFINWYIIADKSKFPIDMDFSDFYRYADDCTTIYSIDTKFFVGCSVDEFDYGCSVANVGLSEFDKANDSQTKQHTLVYLLDDDNLLHDNFYKCVIKAFDSVKNPTIFNITWKDGTFIDPLQFLLRKSHKHCHGIDSAQMLLPLDLLISVNGYSGGVKIDCTTLDKIINKCNTYTIVDIVGASYNPINSKRVSYDEVVEHPTKWYNSETDEF